MGIRRAISILALIICCGHLLGKNDVRLSFVIPSYHEGVLLVHFNLRDAQPNETYNIELQVKRSNGMVVGNVETVTGDLYNLNNGSFMIKWNMWDDQIYVHERLSVSLLVTRNIDIPLAPYLLKSALLPGWGNLKLSNGKWHPLIGVGAFGTAAVAIGLKDRSQSQYSKYTTSMNVIERQEYYKSAENAKNGYNVMRVTTGVIWLAGIVKVLVAHKKVTVNTDPENSKYFHDKATIKIPSSAKSLYVDSRTPYLLSLVKADSLMNLGLLVEAKNECEQALSYKRNDDHAQRLNDRLKIRLDAFNRVIDSTLVLVDQHRFEEARTVFKEAKILYILSPLINTTKSKIDQTENDFNFKNYVDQADLFNGNQEFAKAVEVYEKALLIYPNRSEVRKKLTACVDAIKLNKKKDLLAKYTGESKQLETDGFFEPALNLMIAAQNLFPDDKTIGARVDVLRFKREEKVRMAKFDQLFSEGRNQMISEDFESALQNFEAAIKVNPNHSGTVQKIKNCKSEIKKLEEKRKRIEFEKIKATAKKEYANKSYSWCKSSCESALKLYPNDQSIKELLNRAIGGMKYDKLIEEARRLADRNESTRANDKALEAQKILNTEDVRNLIDFIARKNTSHESETKTYAVVVGVEILQIYVTADMRLDPDRPTELNSAKNDASEFRAYLQSDKAGRVPLENIELLRDAKATKAEIKMALRTTFAKARSQDRVFFFFSGHGTNEGILPYDYRNLLSKSEIDKEFSKCKAKHKFMIVDACKSGSMKGMKGEADDMSEALDLAYKNSKGGHAILASSTASQGSLEDPYGLGQGVFTYFLIKGLEGEADNNLNSVITIRELYDYVKLKVSQKTNYKQTPTLGGRYEDDMPVGVLKK